MPQGHLRVLAVDDNASHVALLKIYLERIEGVTISLKHVLDGTACLEALKDPQIDVVFLDYSLGRGESGLEILKRIRAGNDTRGIIVSTASTNVSLAVKLTQAGADDYIEKTSMTSEGLRRALAHALGQRRRREAMEENRRLLKELKNANRRLERKNTRLAELYKTAHQFVDNVSHEFRTPLAVIKEYASLIRDGVLGEVNSEQIEFLDVIGNRVEDLALMVDDMLEISRFGAGLIRVKRQGCSLADVIDHIRPNLDRRASINKVSLEIDLPCTIPDVYCDPEKVGRTIINLAVNGLKFAPEGGNVHIDAAVNPGQGEASISVRDNGPGISPENQRLIFERFKQVHGEVRQSTKGFGLGLNIARELVHANLGCIELHSQLGRGSTFRFTVPLDDPPNVLRRYLDWVLVLDERADVTLIWCAVHDPRQASASPEADEFIRSHVRPRDLVFSVATGLWLLVAQCGEHESKHMIERLRQTRDDYNRNLPGGEIPELEYRPIDTWPLPDQRDALAERFGQIYQAGVTDVA